MRKARYWTLAPALHIDNRKGAGPMKSAVFSKSLSLLMLSASLSGAKDVIDYRYVSRGNGASTMMQSSEESIYVEVSETTTKGSEEYEQGYGFLQFGWSRGSFIPGAEYTAVSGAGFIPGDMVSGNGQRVVLNVPDIFSLGIYIFTMHCPTGPGSCTYDDYVPPSTSILLEFQRDGVIVTAWTGTNRIQATYPEGTYITHDSGNHKRGSATVQGNMMGVEMPLSETLLTLEAWVTWDQQVSRQIVIQRP
jgi:hypothetical protein